MRKLILLALVLMLCASALAEVDAAYVLNYYNPCASVFGLPDIDPEDAEPYGSKGNAFSVTAGSVKLVFMAGGTTSAITTARCETTDADSVDFLAHCSAIYVYLFGARNVMTLEGYALYSYLSLRSGEDALPACETEDGGVYAMKHDGDRFIFLAGFVP